MLTANDLLRAIQGKKRPGRMPRQQPPDQQIRTYARELRALLADLRAEISPYVDDALRYRTDAYHVDVSRRVQALIDRAEAALGGIANQSRIERLASQVAQATSTHQRRQLSRQVLKALGVDLLGTDHESAKIVESFVGENVALIRGLARKSLSDIEEAVTRGIASGTPTKQIATEIANRNGISDRKAMVIARDQVGKLNGQLNAERQKELGVTKFIWRTVQDRRVRGTPGGAYPNAKPSHFDRNGKVYSYANPPNGELPGTPIQCRCYAEPVFTDLPTSESQAPDSKQSLAAVRKELRTISELGDQLDDRTIAEIADFHGVAESKIRAIAKPIFKPNVIKLPRPSPDTRSAAEIAAYKKEALDGIDESRAKWQKHVTEADLEKLSDAKQDGLTHSLRSFARVRKAYAATLTDEARDAALYYSHQGDGLLNTGLRRGRLPADLREKSIALDEAIARYKVPEDTYVQRGLKGEWAEKLAARIKPGDVFRESGYTSTAATEAFDGAVSMRIKIPKGYNAAPIPSRYPDEAEFLLPKGSRFKIVSVQDRGNTARGARWLVEAEVVK